MYFTIILLFFLEFLDHYSLRNLFVDMPEPKRWWAASSRSKTKMFIFNIFLGLFFYSLSSMKFFVNMPASKRW